jgi:subfamily B ATP-binding cassette protein HlyB/CyaB
MAVDAKQQQPADGGVVALVRLLRLHGVGADPAQIHHQFAGISVGVPEMLRCARGLGLKARAVRTN